MDSHIPLDTIDMFEANFDSALLPPRPYEVPQVAGDMFMFRYQGHIRIGYRVAHPAPTDGGQNIGVRWALLDNGVRVDAAENTHGVLVPLSEIRLLPDARAYR